MVSKIINIYLKGIVNYCWQIQDMADRLLPPPSKKLWPETFSLVINRHPFSRIVSLYHDKFSPSRFHPTPWHGVKKLLEQFGTQYVADWRANGEHLAPEELIK